MPRKYLIPLITVGVFLLVLVGGAYAYDSATSQTIESGVTVGGVNVGGLNADEARAKLHQNLLASLEVPVTVTRGSESWQLGPSESKVGVDIDGSVNAALSKGNSGNFITRAIRKISGSSADATVVPTVTYSAPAARRFTDRVTRAIDRPAKDASLTFTVSAVAPVASKPGVAVNRRALRSAVATALATPGISHRVPVTVRVLKPKVTTGQLAQKYPVLITVDRSNFRLTLFKNLKPVKTYPIAVGRAGLETPAGLYSIQDKQVNPSWHVPNSAWAG